VWPVPDELSRPLCYDSSRPDKILKVMRFKGLVSSTATLLLLVALPVSAQSLADLAKKEEERRKKLPEPAKVYTNKDLGSTPSSSTPAAPDATAPAATAPKADAADKDQEKEKEKENEKDQAKDTEKPKTKEQDKDPKKTPEYWAKQMKSLQDEVARNETYAEALQSRINALQTDFVNRDDPAQRAVIDQNRRKSLAELDRLKKAIADGRKAISDFEEDARRAGIPPGWLR